MKTKIGYKQIFDIIKELKGKTIDLSIRVKIDFEDMEDSQIIIQRIPKKPQKRKDKILKIIKKYKTASPAEIIREMEKEDSPIGARATRLYLKKLLKEGKIKANKKSKTDPTTTYIISGV